MPISVITGDFVQSTKARSNEVHAAFERLALAADGIARWCGGPTYLSRARGDGWQVVVQHPGMEFRAALVLRAAVLSDGRRSPMLDTRMALATGAEDAPETSDLNMALSPTFVASGKGLDDLDGPVHMLHTAGGWHHATAVLLDRISGKWTSTLAQVTAAKLALPSPKGTDIARRLDLAPQTVSNALKAGGYEWLETALSAVEPRHD